MVNKYLLQNQIKEKSQICCDTQIKENGFLVSIIKPCNQLTK